MSFAMSTACNINCELLDKADIPAGARSWYIFSASHGTLEKSKVEATVRHH